LQRQQQRIGGGEQDKPDKQPGGYTFGGHGITS
jgi:hypothetical protein